MPEIPSVGAIPAVCGACGRVLPVRDGSGRRRQYCDATCRSAARRRRDRSAGAASPQDVKLELTPEERHEYLDVVAWTSTTVADIHAAANRLAIAMEAGAGSSLVAVAAARALSTTAAAALQASVDHARAAGHSWKEIGDVLDTSRQAAFQRFGRPVDVRTGEPMNQAAPPGAAGHAAAIFGDLVAGRWAAASADFDARMRERVDTERLAAGWVHTAALIGQFERMGEPLARQVGEYTIVDVPLYFEAGDANGRVTFDRDGKVAGLFIRPASP
jgi:Protein of unknown function (DUF3887)